RLPAPRPPQPMMARLSLSPAAAERSRGAPSAIAAAVVAVRRKRRRVRRDFDAFISIPQARRLGICPPLWAGIVGAFWSGIEHNQMRGPIKPQSPANAGVVDGTRLRC